MEKGCPLSSESPAVFFGPAFSTSERNLIFLSSHSLHAASLPFKSNILFYRPPVSPHGRKTPQERSHCGCSAWGRALCCGSNQALQQQLHAAAPEPAPSPTLSCCFLRTSLSFFFFLPHLHTCMNKLPIPVYNHVGFVNEGGSCCAVCACSALILGRALGSRSSAASKPVSKAFILSTWGWRLGRAGFFEMN